MYSNEFEYKIPVKLFSQFFPEIPEIVLPHSINMHTERLKRKENIIFRTQKIEKNSILHGNRGKYKISGCEVYGARQNRAP